MDFREKGFYSPYTLAVDQDGDVLDILVQKHRDKRAAKRFFRKFLKGLRYAPRRIVTDKLKELWCRTQRSVARCHAR